MSGLLIPANAELHNGAVIAGVESFAESLLPLKRPIIRNRLKLAGNYHNAKEVPSVLLAHGS